MRIFGISAVAALAIVTSSASLFAGTIPEDVEAAINAPDTLDYNWSILMEDESGAIVHYDHDADHALTPASNMKLITTGAAYDLLGPDHVFETGVYYTGTLSGNTGQRTLTGNLYLRVEHDPTWNTTALSNSRSGLDRIADRVRNELGIVSISGQVGIYGAAFYNLGSTNTSHSNPNSSQAALNRSVGTAFLSALSAAGVTVSNDTPLGVYSFTLPANTTLGFTHLSSDLNDRNTGRPLTLGNACYALNKVSHNPMADFMLRHIAYQLDSQNPPRDSYAVAAPFVEDWLENTVALDMTGLNVADGSGLSSSDKVSARQLVDLVRYLVNKYPVWAETLPISGVNGTLSGRLGGTLYGDVHAKTGTLPNGGVVSLSGYIDHPLDGRRYFFSTIINTPSGPVDTTAGRGTIDEVVRVLGDRMPPISPDLRFVGNTIGSETIATWTDPGFESERYRLYANASGEIPQIAAETSAVYIIQSGNSDDLDGENREDYSDSGAWEDSSSVSRASGLVAGTGSRFIRPTSGVGTATFAPSDLPEGRYRVDATCFDFTSADAPGTTVRIADALGTHSSQFEMSDKTAGDRWRSVGTIEFLPDSGHRVEFSNENQLNTGVDDRLNISAVRFVPLFTKLGHPDAALNLRVSSTSSAGLETETSDVYTSDNTRRPRVLVVDGFDRWNSQPENLDASNHDFGVITGDSIPESFATAANEAIVDGSVHLGDYRIVVWILGEESTADEAFSDLEQPLVAEYFAGGGHLFLSGSEIAWDLGRATGSSVSDITFFNDVLHAGYVADDAQTYTAVDVPGIFGGLGSIDFDNGDVRYDVAYPDVLTPVGTGATEVLSYSGGTGGTAAIAYDGSSGGGKIVYLGFPFETILAQSDRDEIMRRTFEFFGEDQSPSDLWLILGE